MSLEELTDDQLATLTENEYQQLMQREQRHDAEMRERIVRAHRQQQALMREQQMAAQMKQRLEEQQIKARRQQIQYERQQMEMQIQQNDQRLVVNLDSNIQQHNQGEFGETSVDVTTQDQFSASMARGRAETLNRVTFQESTGISRGRGRSARRAPTATITAAEASIVNQGDTMLGQAVPGQFADADNIITAQQLANEENLYDCRDTGIRSLQRHGLWDENFEMSQSGAPSEIRSDGRWKAESELLCWRPTGHRAA